MKSKTRLFLIASLIGAVTKAVAYNNTLTVSNIAELQSLNVPSLIQSGYTNLSVFVQGYYTQGDRGGGMFRWDGSSTATFDWGRYFPTNGWVSGAGRWIRQLNGETANVRMWGAKGDWQPSADYSGSSAHNDTTNIQNALTALGVWLDSGGNSPWTRELLFPSGVYKITDTLVCNLSLVKIHGEQGFTTQLMVPSGMYYKDILRTTTADAYLKGQTPGGPFDEAVRIEDLGFYFLGWDTNQVANPTNACLAIAGGQEGFSIRNVFTFGGAFGIRSFGGGNGAVLAFRDVVTSDATVAGVSIEPAPGANSCAGQVSIHGITGDNFIGTPPGISSLVRFLNYNSVASIEDLNAEGYYGGGVIKHTFPPLSSGIGDVAARLGCLNIRNCNYNGGGAYDFLVLTGQLQTASVTIENVNLYTPAGNLIRDQLIGRNVLPPDNVASGTLQATCRLPVQYESYDYRNGDFFYGRGSRLIIGDSAVYSFTPSTQGWYRIARNDSVLRVGGRMAISGFSDVTEFSAEVPFNSGSGAQINVIRPSFDNGQYPPAVTMVRAGSYYDNNDYGNGVAGPRGFVDMYVEHTNQSLKISYALNGLMVPGVGQVPLLFPTNALAGLLPDNCTFQQCVTNSVTNLVTCCSN